MVFVTICTVGPWTFMAEGVLVFCHTGLNGQDLDAW
jgi:hypothetical protein